MTELRESVVLPTIRCSSCSLQVEISLMGDHLCPGPSLELSSAPDSNGKFNNQPFNAITSAKYGHLPSLVDTDAANRMYTYQGQLTPISQSGRSGSISPITPYRPSFSDKSEGYFASGPMRGSGSARTPTESPRPGVYGGSQDPTLENAAAPSKPSGESLLERMNGVASGPFGANQPLASRNVFPLRKDSLTKWDGFFLVEPASGNGRPASSNNSIVSTGSNDKPFTPKQPKNMAYEGFGPPSNTSRESEPISLGHVNRSETFPKPAIAATKLTRRPSYPTLQSSRYPLLDITGSERRPPMDPDTARPPPPRTSLNPQDLRADCVDLAIELGAGNPSHTPSSPASSGYSVFSSRSQASSQTSPTLSEPHEKVHGASKKDTSMDSLLISSKKLRPADIRIDLTAQVVKPPRSPHPASPLAISPRDNLHSPSIQHGLGYEPFRPYNRPPPSTPYGSSPQPQENQSLSPWNETSPGPTGTPPRVISPSRKGSRDPSQTSRGDCKLCSQPITGKSVSSADGRLTGKYHKACFACTDCSAPFTSAEFYVLDDKPYCELHYHKLNGSLCGGCGRGIEGQFVEDESRVKHHINCFCCVDCGQSLSSSYFEVDGKACCERDALRRTQATPVGPMHGEGGSYPQSPQRGGFGRLGPRPFGGPSGRPMGLGGPGLRPCLGPPGIQRGPYGGLSPSRLGPGQGQRPQMNKRMTRQGMM